MNCVSSAAEVHPLRSQVACAVHRALPRVRVVRNAAETDPDDLRDMRFGIAGMLPERLQRTMVAPARVDVRAIAPLIEQKLIIPPMLRRRWYHYAGPGRQGLEAAFAEAFNFYE